MKKFFGKANTYSLLIDIASIFVFFAPFVQLKGSVTPTKVLYITGFQAIFGGSGFDGMSIPVLCMFVFILSAVLLNLLAYKFRFLSLLNFILECGTAVLMFLILKLINAGLEISPSWVMSVYAGSMVIGGLLIVSSLFSLVNLFAGLRRKNPEEQA